MRNGINKNAKNTLNTTEMRRMNVIKANSSPKTLISILKTMLDSKPLARILALITIATAVISLVTYFVSLLNTNMYLSSEYTKVRINSSVEISLTTEFDTDKAVITGISPTGKTYDLELVRIDNNKWSKKVTFDEVGEWKVKATATKSKGKDIHRTIKIDVLSLF